jgi:DNA-binding MarR family transcriptional regulator
MQSTKQFSEILHEWTAMFMHRSFRDFKRFMDEAELSPSQANTMMRLYHNDTCSFSKISEQLGVTNAATSQLVERLVQMKLISRTEDPADRRNKILTLTPEGKQLLERAISARSQWMEELAAHLTPEQQTNIATALVDLMQAARALENDAAGQADQKKKSQ